MPGLAATATAADPAQSAPPAWRTSTANAPSSTSTAEATASQARELSPFEEMRERARSLEPEVAAIAHEAEAVDALFSQYIGRCYDRFSTHKWADRRRERATPHEWLVVPLAEHAWQERWVSVPGVVWQDSYDVENCRRYWRDFFVSAAAVVQALEDLEEDARRAGLLPGHVDELLEEHHLAGRAR